MQKKDKIIRVLALVVLLLVAWCVWLSYRVIDLQKQADNNEWHTRELYNELYQ